MGIYTSIKDAILRQQVSIGTGSGIESLLNAMSRSSGKQLEWKNSLVDLMILVGVAPSLPNLAELARELGYAGNIDDSATMNAWLHVEIMRHLNNIEIAAGTTQEPHSFCSICGVNHWAPK